MFLPRSRRCILTIVCILFVASAFSQTAPTADPKEEALVLSPFEVTTQSDRGYLSTSSVSASRINTPVKNIPQSIFVMTDELLRDSSPLTLNDSLTYAPGVSNNSTAGESFSLRGYAVQVALTNGFRLPRTFPTDQADIQRVEVLMGPASVLYGNVFGVGGVINRVSKRPLFTTENSIQLVYKESEQNTKRVVLDSTGPIGQSKKIAYRLIASWQKAGLVQDGSKNDRLVVYPKFLWKISDTSKLVLEFQWGHQIGTVGNGVAMLTSRDYFKSSTDSTIIRVPRTSNPGLGLDAVDVIPTIQSAEFTSKLGEHWSFRAAEELAWAETKAYFVTSAAAIGANGQTVNRTAYTYRDRGVGNQFIQVDFSGDYKFKSVTLKPQFGLEYAYDSDGNYTKIATTTLPAFNLFAPDYSVPAPTSFRFSANPRNNTFSPGAFGVLQASFFDDRLILNLGERITYFTGVARLPAVTPATAKGSTTGVPRYGAVARISKDINVYYGHSEAYQPVTATNPDGSVLEPITGKQDEVGVKTGFFGQRLTATAAIFQLEAVNQPVNDPNRTGYRVSQGAVKSKGFDMSLIATITENWQVIAGYTHVKQTTTGSTNPALIGISAAGVIPNFANLWTRYAFKTGRLKGLSFGAGGRWAAATPVVFSSTGLSTREIPNYKVYDGLLGYDFNKHFRFQLNVKNLSNTRYYVDGNASNLTVAEPRSVTTTVTYKF